MNSIGKISFWIFFSILLVFLGLWLQQSQESTLGVLRQVGEIVPGALITLGISILLGVIFSIVITSKGFLDIVTERLTGIVISKKYAGMIKDEDRLEILKNALVPKNESRSMEAELKGFYDSSVEDLLNRINSPCRGQMTIDATASFDFEKGCVRLDWVMSYSIFRFHGEFEPIEFHLHSDGGEHFYTKLVSDSNISHDYSDEDIEKEKSKLPCMDSVFTLPIPESMKGCGEILVRRHVAEWGDDHWALFMYKATKPCHRLIVRLKCENGLKIKHPQTLGAGRGWEVSPDSDSRQSDYIEFLYHDWLSPGFGVSAVVAIDHDRFAELKQSVTQADHSEVA